MEKDLFYQEQYQKLIQSCTFTSEFPDETAETTLKALWNAALGVSCSATCAKSVALKEIPQEKETLLISLVDKRIQGIPLAHLTGRVHFMGCELLYEPNVPIPRAETELLCTTVHDIFSDAAFDSQTFTGIDVGCGSGNLTCAIAKKFPRLYLYATDIAASCVSLTNKNAAFLHLNDRITVYQGDLLSPLTGAGLEGKIDFIVSNPPYISSSKLQKDLSHLVIHEPEAAFNGGIYGFSIHQRLLKESLPFLKPAGFLLFEFGLGQEKQVMALFNRAKGYTPVEFASDPSGNPRVAIAQKNSDNDYHRAASEQRNR